ncbi:MAG TPA: CAP domain-containing protein [Chloroflexota bacterium]|nr:CAP domain-containing protein [Chloroflexota bacterium]
MNKLGSRGTVAGCAAAVLLLSSALVMTPQVAAHPVPAAKQHLKEKKLRRYVLKLINGERKTMKVKALALNGALSRCATRHSQAMEAAGKLFHDLSQDACITFTAAGENIGVTSGAVETALARMNAEMWAEGPCPSACPLGTLEWERHGHYLNLVNPAFHRVGVGIVVGGGGVWLTEDFTN